MKPGIVINRLPVTDKIENNEYYISNEDTSPIILCEPSDINFSIRTIKIFSSENTKVSERMLKNRLLSGKNFKIELSVANYIFFVESLACYRSNLAKLRRLNI